MEIRMMLGGSPSKNEHDEKLGTVTAMTAI
jgi:hypothetical protein